MRRVVTSCFDQHSLIPGASRAHFQVGGRTFAATSETAFYRLRTAVTLVVTGVTLVACGCPIQAIVMAFGLDERTVRDWVRGVHQQLVVQPRDLGQVQADELGVKQQGQRVWLASAIQGPARLWLGGVISATRDGTLIAQWWTSPRFKGGLPTVSELPAFHYYLGLGIELYGVVALGV